MKLKMSDLKLLMEYLEKEHVAVVEAEEADLDNSMTFSFADLENRGCKIKLYGDQFNITPELTKVMKLYSRMKKDEKAEA